jgi:histidinol-phosphatase (PHP family)
MSAVSRGLVDYHVHSTQSVDGRSSVDDMCRQAIRLELSEIGFCEHVDFEPSDHGFCFFDCERYSKTIDMARSKYSERLLIRKGVEIDYSPAHETQIREWIRDKSFDFTVGSVHYIGHTSFDLRMKLPISPEYVVSEYYAKIRQAVESRLFNVIGHFDLVRSYVPSESDQTSTASDLIDAALERIVTGKVHLEINSRRRSNQEPFPSRRLIQQYLDKGGERFSFGSDAHSTQQLGIGIAEAMNLLKSLGPKAIYVLFGHACLT